LVTNRSHNSPITPINIHLTLGVGRNESVLASTLRSAPNWVSSRPILKHAITIECFTLTNRVHEVLLHTVVAKAGVISTLITVVNT